MLDITPSCQELKLLVALFHLTHATPTLVGFRYEAPPISKALRLSMKRHSRSRNCLVHFGRLCGKLVLVSLLNLLYEITC